MFIRFDFESFVIDCSNFTGISGKTWSPSCRVHHFNFVKICLKIFSNILSFRDHKESFPESTETSFCIVEWDLIPEFWLCFLLRAFFCSWPTESPSYPDVNSCSERFFLLREDCSTFILDKAIIKESLISISSSLKDSSGEEDKGETERSKFRREFVMGLGGGAQGNSFSCLVISEAWE